MNRWLWAFVSKEMVLYLTSKNRGKEVVIKVFDEDYEGVSGQDFYPSFDDTPGEKQGVCRIRGKATEFCDTKKKTGISSGKKAGKTSDECDRNDENLKKTSSPTEKNISSVFFLHCEVMEQQSCSKEKVPEEEIELICKEVIEKIKPKEREKRKITAVTDYIIKKINEKVSERGINAHPILVGSSARNTWVSGEEDIDIFIMFPEDLPESILKERGLEIAKSISERYEERYASHPYIRAYFYDKEGIEHEADLVPCFSVRNASLLKSAVDRTPFHNEYVAKRIGGKEDEVLLLKQFMKSIGVYGAEQRITGFSGYLCELFILYYSSFLNTIKSATEWKYGKRIDIEGDGKYEGEDPLVIIDPIDPHRNAAAAVSLYSFCRLIDAARDFLKRPDEFFFFPSEVKPMRREEFLKKVEERGMEIVMILFEAPKVVDDILFPQLRKASSSIANLIERHGFKVYRHEASVVLNKAFLIFELLVSKLPNTKKHIGPPVTLKEHAEKFKRKYTSFSYPIFIEDGRYVVEITRKYTIVADLLKNELKTCSLGKHVSEAISSGYEVLSSDEIPFYEGLGYFFKDYFCGSTSYFKTF